MHRCFLIIRDLLVAYLFLCLFSLGFAQSAGLDPSFGTGGLVTTDLSGGLDNANDVQLQNDGKIVVGGFTRVGFNPNKLLLLRYNEDGSPDMNFDKHERRKI